MHQITDGDTSGQMPCVHLYDDFEHSGPHGRHVCMAFEVIRSSRALKAMPFVVHDHLTELSGTELLSMWSARRSCYGITHHDE